MIWYLNFFENLNDPHIMVSTFWFYCKKLSAIEALQYYYNQVRRQYKNTNKIVDQYKLLTCNSLNFHMDGQ